MYRFRSVKILSKSVDTSGGEEDEAAAFEHLIFSRAFCNSVFLERGEVPLWKLGFLLIWFL